MVQTDHPKAGAPKKTGSLAVQMDHPRRPGGKATDFGRVKVSNC